MQDPYKVLGISPNATDEEIKNAYRNLARKYHPDNYHDSPLSDLAAEKMKEINEAYDTIVNSRKKTRQGSTGYSYGRGYSSDSSYNDVRNLIANGRISDAELLLNGVPQEARNAEWYFLKGTVLYKKGWLDESSRNFQRACQIEPNNPEYAAAFNQIKKQRQGSFGGYNTAAPRGCSGCDVCTSLLCADCCCECMGGDIIRCC